MTTTISVRWLMVGLVLLASGLLIVYSPPKTRAAVGVNKLSSTVSRNIDALVNGYLGNTPNKAPRLTLGVVFAGQREPLGRFSATENGELDFFDLKGTLEALITRLGVNESEFRGIDSAALHPGRAAGLVARGDQIGILGELRHDRAQAFGIEAPRVAVAEIDLDALREVAHPIPAAVSVPRFLPVEQDFAIVVAEETRAAGVEAALRAGAGPLATAVTLFDIYRGPQIGAERKSLAYRVTFTAPDRALTDAELSKVRERIARTLQKIGGELRA